jgi:hypothetical protein
LEYDAFVDYGKGVDRRGVAGEFAEAVDDFGDQDLRG